MNRNAVKVKFLDCNCKGSETYWTPSVIKTGQYTSMMGEMGFFRENYGNIRIVLK